VTTSNPTNLASIQLAPSYTLPLVLVLAAMPMLLFSAWLGGAIALLGLFLMFQAVTLRLQFTETALDIYRGEALLRRFPYQEWQNWEIFWTSFPILLYFKEVKSIHFLPILFDPKMLKTCLEQRCPRTGVRDEG
jgi:hypothetical protein